MAFDARPVAGEDVEEGRLRVRRADEHEMVSPETGRVEVGLRVVRGDAVRVPPARSCDGAVGGELEVEDAPLLSSRLRGGRR